MRITGATTIGIRFKNGVILASERRVSYGYFVMSKSGKKVFRITENVGAACAGLVSDMQMMTRAVSAYSKIYSYDLGRPSSVRATAKLMGNILFQRRFFPYLAQTIIGGIDSGGSRIYVLDPLGSVIEDDYAAVGSGSEIAIGVLEAEYKENLSETEAMDLVKKAIKSAVSRDIGSGEGVDMLIITEKEMKEESYPLITT
jgi:proteasome beta subunit